MGKQELQKKWKFFCTKYKDRKSKNDKKTKKMSI